MKRPICTECNRNPCAVNYKKDGKVYYRSKCNQCNGKRIKPFIPRWRQQGYVKKTTCDICGFKAKYGSQIVVFHINGNLNDSNITNLRSVCLNCTIEIDKKEMPWKPGDLKRDF